MKQWYFNSIRTLDSLDRDRHRYWRVQFIIRKRSYLAIRSKEIYPDWGRGTTTYANHYKVHER